MKVESVWKSWVKPFDFILFLKFFFILFQNLLQLPFKISFNSFIWDKRRDKLMIYWLHELLYKRYQFNVFTSNWSILAHFVSLRMIWNADEIILLKVGFRQFSTDEVKQFLIKSNALKTDEKNKLIKILKRCLFMMSLTCNPQIPFQIWNVHIQSISLKFVEPQNELLYLRMS